MSGGSSAARSTSVSAVLFTSFLGAGVAYIIATKSLGVSTFWATLVPLLIISGYAVLLVFARYLRLRDDQAGDNLYYLGFLYTLTSLGVSLWNFSTSGGAEAVVTNFGVAVSSTILGVALRVIFGQMRQDPLEVERTARLELAEAARRVRQELDATVFELSSFRRATQQSLAEGMLEVKKHIELASANVTDALKDMPARSMAPFEMASKQAAEALAKLSSTLSTGLERNVSKLTAETERLASTAEEVTTAIASFRDQLNSTQTPEGIIEIKLQPTIRSLTKALKDLSERLGAQIDQLQTVIAAATVASREATNDSKLASAEHNRNLERIVSSLSLNDQTLKRLLDRIQEFTPGREPMRAPVDRPSTSPSASWLSTWVRR
jgi:hypothetical protein